MGQAITRRMKYTKLKVLITGGSSGIGLALAKKFAENENTVIITGRNLSKLEKITTENPSLHAIQSDVTSDEDVNSLAATMREKFGGIDVLINNAGIMNLVNSGLKTNDIRKQFEEIEINYSSPIRLLHHFLPQLIQSNDACLINVSSGLAYVSFSQAPVYSGTKAALHFWTKAIRPQLKGHGIKVIELMPPVVDTPLADAANINDDSNLKPMPPETLAEIFWNEFTKGKEEITPGITKQLKFMSRIAPQFIFNQLNKKPIPVVNN